MFRQEAFNADQVFRELYDPAKPGAMVVRSFLDVDFRKILLQEIYHHGHLFRPAQRKYLNAYQEFSYFYIGEADEEHVQADFKTVFALRDRYADLYRSFQRPTNSSATCTLNSVAVQKYPQGSIGITLHRDASRYVNLISIFVLKGVALFLVSSDREPSHANAVHTAPGDLILLRAPRDRESSAEKRLRPFHAVGGVLEERITLLLRERVG